MGPRAGLGQELTLTDRQLSAREPAATDHSRQWRGVFLRRLFIIYPQIDASTRRARKLRKLDGYSAASLHGGGHTALLLLGDVAAAFANATVLHYSCCDYEMPLLQGNALYR